MSLEETSRIPRPTREELQLVLAEQAARLLFEHLEGEAGAPPEKHAARAREIYDHLRRLTTPTEPWDSQRADTLDEALSAGESGVTRKPDQAR